MKRLEILIIGAGFSGICSGIKLLERGISDFRIVDKNKGIGGTWHMNTYPGAACDVQSHFYSFSFEPNPDWSRLYPPQPEIKAYIESCARKYGLMGHINLGVEVKSMRFDEKKSGWVVSFTDGSRVFARYVINAMGGLHLPAYPDIPGREKFRGVAMHTARWQKDFDWKNKRIAVVGSAASAIQIIPKLAKRAKQVDVYQRTANFISPRGDYAYSKRAKWIFANIPFVQRIYRWLIMMRMDVILYPIVTSAKRRERLGNLIRRYMYKVVRDPELQKKLDPDFEVGCKRILISDDFYATLNRKNTEVITDGIRSVNATGIVTNDGRARKYDAIIWATGFDLREHGVSVDVTGRNGLTLREAWKDITEAYRGVMVTGFPNYFNITGPNTGVGTTSVVFMIEKAVGWVMRAIDAADGKTIEVTAPAQRKYNARIHKALAGTVWATGCKSWYKREDGRIETLYPGNAADWSRELRQLDLSDIKIKA